MTKKEHSHADILRAIADGEAFEMLVSRAGNWQWEEVSTTVVLQRLVEQAYEASVMRIKPRVIHINGHEVPEPCRDAPAEGRICWIPVIGNICGSTDLRWDSGSMIDRTLLFRGLVHLTQEAAQAHAKALLSFTQQTP